MVRRVGKRVVLSGVIVICLVLSACSYYKPQEGHPAINQINATMQTGIANNELIAKEGASNVPADIGAALLPDMTIAGNSQQASAQLGKRFNIAVNNVPARQFFMGLVKGTSYNMVVSPKVTGNITLDLKNVTVKEALDAVHDLYGYQYQQTSYGYQVYPAGLQTRIFKVNYLDVDRTGKSSTLISSGQVTQSDLSQNNTNPNVTNLSGGDNVAKNLAPASSVSTTTKSNFWQELTKTLNAIVGDKDGSQVIVNPDAGLVIIKAFPARMSEAAKYLDFVQTNMNREVIIDAKVLEVELNHGYQAGINWEALGLSQTGIGTIPATGNTEIDNGLKAFTQFFALKGSYHHSFSILINLLATEGNVQVLSSPRIATMNNQKAIIKVGDDEFFITNVENTAIVVGSSAETSQDIDLTPFFSGIALDVTPEISSNGSVILHIHPIVSKVTDQNKKFTVSGEEQDLPLALSQIRESDSIVRAKNGQIVVIGGLMENKTQETIASTPFLSKVPLVGPLFRRTNQQSVKTELVILLRPIIVDPQTLNNTLTKAAAGFRKLDRGFHFGAYPEVFGNTGEPRLPSKKAKASSAAVAPQSKRTYYK